MVIGIDIGGSTTKIVGFRDGRIIQPLIVKANDPVASAFGALGKFINENKVPVSSLEHIAVTGVGSNAIESDLFGVPVSKVDEFLAIGLGGLYLSELKRAIVVSMGTGTALVRADENSVVHLGGTGVGGGTLMGLSKCILGMADFNEIIKTAMNGKLENVDLTVGDISRGEIQDLPSHITASNFGKMSDNANRNDYALAIINLVFQTIGMIAIFASRIEKDKDIILTGNLVKVPQIQMVFAELSSLFKVNFYIPDNAEFATAIGAAIAYYRNIRNH